MSAPDSAKAPSAQQPGLSASDAKPSEGGLLKTAQQWLRKKAAAIHMPHVVPIRELGERHRSRILTHLLRLEPRDRYLRFGYAASDEQVQRYVEKLDFENDDIFGIFNRRLSLIGMAHLSYTTDAKGKKSAEFGVSVLKIGRGLGLGTRLFTRAATHAQNLGIHTLHIQALSENTGMLKIARRAGATVERDGTESEAWLQLPEASLDSRVGEMVEKQIAEVDYQIKKQRKQFWDILADVQQMRQTNRDGQHQAAE